MDVQQNNRPDERPGIARNATLVGLLSIGGPLLLSLVYWLLRGPFDLPYNPDIVRLVAFAVVALSWYVVPRLLPIDCPRCGEKSLKSSNVPRRITYDCMNCGFCYDPKAS